MTQQTDDQNGDTQTQDQTDDTSGSGSNQDQTNSGDDRVTFDADQQAALDRIVSERLKRERQKWQEKVEQERTEAERKVEEEKLAEQKKWQELAEKREAEVAEREAELDKVKSQHRNYRLQTETERLARTLGFSEEAAADAHRFLNPDTFEESDDGGFDGLEKALKDLLKAKPYMQARENGQVPDVDATKKGKGKNEPDEESLRRRFRIS